MKIPWLFLMCVLISKPKLIFVRSCVGRTLELPVTSDTSPSFLLGLQAEMSKGVFHLFLKHEAIPNSPCCLLRATNWWHCQRGHQLPALLSPSLAPVSRAVSIALTLGRGCKLRLFQHTTDFLVSGFTPLQKDALSFLKPVLFSGDKMANGCFGYNAACLLAGVRTQLWDLQWFVSIFRQCFSCCLCLFKCSMFSALRHFLTTQLKFLIN